MRFSCSYYDDVTDTIENFIRPKLKKLRNYQVNLEKYGLKDKDLMNNSDPSGYRAYHFYVNVPVSINIFDQREAVLCEIQGHSELQHMWAVKSHDLLYKKEEGWLFLQEEYKNIVDDMKIISDNLKNIDYYLMKIKNKVRGKKDYPYEKKSNNFKKK